MPQQLLQSKILTLFLTLLFIVLGFSYLLQNNLNEKYIVYTDFGKFYESAQQIVHDKNPYANIYIQKKASPDDPSPKIKTFGANLNPPFFQLLIQPLAFLSYRHALQLWTILSILCGVLSIIFLCKNFKVQSFNFILLSVLGFFAYFPAFLTIAYGQLTLLMLPLVLGAWVAARSRSDRALGILLGIAASIKLFFGLFLIYFLIRREFKSLAWFCGTIIVCMLLPLTILNGRVYLDYFHAMHHIVWYTSSMNASLYGFFGRIFGVGEKNIPLILIPGLAQKLYWFFSGVLTIAIIYFLKPNNKISEQEKCDLDFSIILIGMLLLSPLGWSYYFLFLIIPFCVLLQAANKDRAPFFLIPVIVLAVILSADAVLINPAEVNSSTIALIGSELCFYSLILFFGLIFYVRKLSECDYPKSGSIFPQSLIVPFFIVMLIPSFLAILHEPHLISKVNLMEHAYIVRVGK